MDNNTQIALLFEGVFADRVVQAQLMLCSCTYKFCKRSQQMRNLIFAMLGNTLEGMTPVVPLNLSMFSKKGLYIGLNSVLMCSFNFKIL